MTLNKKMNFALIQWLLKELPHMLHGFGCHPLDLCRCDLMQCHYYDGCLFSIVQSSSDFKTDLLEIPCFFASLRIELLQHGVNQHIPVTMDMLIKFV